MPNDKQVGGKWEQEKRALKKIQLHFTFQQQRSEQIQHEAIDNRLKPSDLIRKIVGLPFKKIQRPRIGISLDENDIGFLAEKYNVAKDNEAEIKRRVTEEVNLYCDNQKE